MPLPKLLEAIERDALAEREAGQAARRREAEAIVAAASAEAARIQEDVVEAATAAAAAEQEATLARARLAAAAAARDTREAAYQETLEAVRERLSTLRDEPAYPGVLGALIAECRAALPAGRELHVDARDAGLARAFDPLLMVYPSLDGWGGCELEDAAGRRARNTLESRLAAADATLRERLLGLADRPPEAA